MAQTVVDACGFCGHDVILGEEMDHVDCVEQLISQPEWWV